MTKGVLESVRKELTLMISVAALLELGVQCIISAASLYDADKSFDFATSTLHPALKVLDN